MNRLSTESSPYLRQHAGNPVNWWPWCRGAFQEAQRLRRPIFLSIGYSTCHWCHVMARESFADSDVAQSLNEHFVSIKVDREERPDVDHLYMKFVVASTGHGGWPLSVFLTPEGRPFLGGTYFRPAHFQTLLNGVADLWASQPLRVQTAADLGIQAIRAADSTPMSQEWTGKAGVLETVLRGLADTDKGGFLPAPKFPMPMSLAFLLLHSKAERPFVEQTLRAMAKGGIHDHVGGGFHRYSVDAGWHVPHFEKMLYDQAQMLSLYAQSMVVLSGRATCEHVCYDIVRYVKARLLSPQGAFYAAEDADSLQSAEAPEAEKEEGAFALWTSEQIGDLLDNPRDFMEYFGIQMGGNVPDELDAHSTMQRKNILHVPADQPYPPPASIESQLAVLRDRQRPRPHRDDKIIAAWNGYMISALVDYYRVTQDEPALQMAMKAADFVLNTMYSPSTGILHRSWCAGSSTVEGVSDDYASMTRACLDLHMATLDTDNWLAWAVKLQGHLDASFFDLDAGCYLQTSLPSSDALLPCRLGETYDGVEPSANSLAYGNLLRLSLQCPESSWPNLEKLEIFMKALPPPAIALGLHYGVMREKSALVKLFGPTVASVKQFHTAVLSLPQDQLIEIQFIKKSEVIEAQVCRDGTCELPVSDVASLLAKLHH